MGHRSVLCVPNVCKVGLHDRELLGDGGIVQSDDEEDDEADEGDAHYAERHC